MLTDEQKGSILYWLTIVLVVIGILVFWLMRPAKAESIYPVSIPAECVELAQRENRPLELKSKSEALAAKARLYLMKRDALVNQCREGVKRVEAQIKAMKQESRK